MNILNEIMKMNTFLKKNNKTLIIDKKSGLIKGFENNLMPNFNNKNKEFGRIVKWKIN